MHDIDAPWEVNAMAGVPAAPAPRADRPDVYAVQPMEVDLGNVEPDRELEEPMDVEASQLVASQVADTGTAAGSSAPCLATPSRSKRQRVADHAP